MSVRNRFPDLESHLFSFLERSPLVICIAIVVTLVLAFCMSLVRLASPGFPLMNVLSLIIVDLVLVSLVVGVFVLRKELWCSFKPVAMSTWIALLLILIGGFIISQGVVHTVWHSNNHGISIVANIRDGLVETDLARLHGYGYQVIIKALFSLLCGTHSIFFITYCISGLSVVMLFLLMYVLFKNEQLALLTALLLQLLPTHMRLAVTECTFIPVELYFLLALLFFVISIRTQQPRTFMIALLPLFLLMQSRVEMIVLAPIVVTALFFVLRDEGGRSILRSKTVWRSIAVFCFLFIPWALSVVAMHDQRMVSFVSQGILHGGDMFRYIFFNERYRCNVFFDTDYTPLYYPVFFCIGVLTLWRTQKNIVLWALLTITFLSVFYGYHVEGVSTYVRTGLTTQWVLIMIAACGIHSLLLSRVRNSMVAGVVWCLIIVCGVGALSERNGPLYRVYSTQQEYSFLEKGRTALPDECTVVLLSAEDDPENVLNREYQSFFLSGPHRRVVSMSRFLKAPVPGAVYVYAGAPCYKLPVTAISRPDQVRIGHYIHPLYVQLRKSFMLNPVSTCVLTKGNLSTPGDDIVDDSVTIGLYRVTAHK